MPPTELFSKRGIRAVGINEVLARAGLATAKLYRHFATKDELGSRSWGSASNAGPRTSSKPARSSTRRK